MSSSAATPAAEAEAEAEGAPSSSPPARPFRVRTVTAFVVLRAEDFGADGGGGSGGVGGDEAVEAAGLAAKLDACRDALRDAERRLTSRGYEVQTVRIATNPFGEWLTVPAGGDGDGSEKEAPSSPPRPEKRARTAPKTSTELDLATDRLAILESMLKRRDVNFCSLGPSLDPGHTTTICPLIVASSGRLSCSASVEAGDVDSARAAAECILEISELGGGGEAEGAKDGDAASLPAPPPHLAGGLGNFRFGSSSRVKTVPFFPAARSPKSLEENEVGFAVGLGNGGFARRLLEEAKSVANVRKVFHAEMREELACVQEACLEVVAASESAFKPSGLSVRYLGIDTSLYPSLDEGGSVAAAIESLADGGARTVRRDRDAGRGGRRHDLAAVRAGRARDGILRVDAPRAGRPAAVGARGGDGERGCDGSTDDPRSPDDQLGLRGGSGHGPRPRRRRRRRLGVADPRRGRAGGTVGQAAELSDLSGPRREGGIEDGLRIAVHVRQRSLRPVRAAQGTSGREGEVDVGKEGWKTGWQLPTSPFSVFRCCPDLAHEGRPEAIAVKGGS
ncbi:hypothetical protein ACHAWF_003855 [Thalassiosira exigua]